jgi:hypothetical protein
MSFSDVRPGDPINASNVQQVIDALKGTAGKGVPLSPTAVNNASSYALTVENLEATNSRALNVLKSDGSTLIKADATGVTLGSPITAPAASINGTALQNASVTNAKLASDTARLNLLTNGGFEIWQRGAGPFTGFGYTADRWQNNGQTGTSVSRDTTNQDNSNTCMAVTTTAASTLGAPSQILNPLNDLTRFKSLTFSFSVRLRTNVANAVRPFIYDGVTTTYGAYVAGDNAYHTASVTMTLAAGATVCQPGFNIEAAATTYVDNAMLVVGSQYADYAPLHPADDLARCLRYYELLGESQSGEIAFLGYGTTGTNGGQTLGFKARKALTPTVTKNGTWVVTNCGQPAVLATGLGAISTYVTVTATGAYNANNNAAGATVSLESNP